MPRLSVLTGLAVLAIAAATGCDSGGRGADAATPTTQETVPVNVAVERVSAGTLTERVELSGRLEPWLEVHVSSELGGMVEEVGFEKGALVKEGQVLARIGSDFHEASLAEAEALLAGAEATYNRARALVERQAVPRQNLINATSEYEAARARVTQSRLRLGRSIVRAPITGVAIAREIEPGEVLSPGTVITIVQRLDRLKATVGIPENDITIFRRGGAATLQLDAWPERTFEGRISFIAPSAVGSTRTFVSEIAVENRDGSLKPGMIARVSLVRQTFEDVVVVSRDALQERDLGTVAVVLEGDVARVREVTLGGVEDDRILVENGLAPGDWLIVSGHRGLIDGQRVQVVERRE
jgi:membrane fusion protein (multidrug efflux system)